MIDLPRPEPLVTIVSTPLTPRELLAGPLGVAAFALLVPLIRLAAAGRRPRTIPADALPATATAPPAASRATSAPADDASARRRLKAALVCAALVWLVPTVGWAASAVFVTAVALGFGWIAALTALRRRGRLGERGMTALVWIGLHAFALPLWWVSYPAWYASRMAPLHAMGFAYLLLRFVAWGVDMAKSPGLPLRPIDTVCWLLYAPVMRLGPVMPRQSFLDQLDRWTHAAGAPAKEILRRYASGILGLALLLAFGRNLPRPPAGGADFLSQPEIYSTTQLVRAFYFVPFVAYLFLWSYNEIAVATSIWIGIRAAENFDHLPRATSVRDLWRRWNITIGAWLRNYIYIPLGGNRGFLNSGEWSVPVNYILAFGYCGVWHGAAWSFVAWGVSQAIVLAAQRWWDRLRARFGWSGQPSGWAWVALCWFLTMHFHIATSVTFADFQHCGGRLLWELARRLCGLAR